MISEKFFSHFLNFIEEKSKNKMNDYVTTYGTTTTDIVCKYSILNRLQGLCYTTENPCVCGSIPPGAT